MIDIFTTSTFYLRFKENKENYITFCYIFQLFGPVLFSAHVYGSFSAVGARLIGYARRDILGSLDQLINLFFTEPYFVCYPFLFSGQEVDKLRQMCKPFCKRKVVTTLFFSVQITLTVFPYFSVGKGTICQQGVVPNLT